MPQLTDKLPKEVEQRFDAEFPNGKWESYVDGFEYESYMFKEFLAKELAQAREDERQRIRTEIASYSPLSLEQTQDLLNRIDSLEDNT